MNRSVEILAPSKLNLTLAVAGRLHSGRHLLRSIVCALSLSDRVKVSTTAQDHIEVRVTLSTELESHLRAMFSESEFMALTDQLQSAENIAAKAAGAFFSRIGSAVGLCIEIEKRIPIQGGLGGGSGDAAATLIALNQIFDGALSEAELLKLGGQLGADVPACMRRGLSLMFGTGGALIPLQFASPKTAAEFTEVGLVVIQPDCGVSTASAYAALGIAANLPPEAEREAPPLDEPDLSNRLRNLQILPVYAESTIKSLEKLTILDEAGSREPLLGESLREVLRGIVRNDFQESVVRDYPPVGAALRALETSGAFAQMLCGSGSSVIGFFSSHELAAQTAASLRKKHAPQWFVGLAKFML